MTDAFSYATLFEDESSITRLLHEHSASKNFKASSPGMIVWYCFIISIILPTCVCVLYCWFTRYRSHRRAQTTSFGRELQHENELAISRIEANIQAFSEVEKNRRTKSMRVAIRRHVMRVSERDLMAAQARERENYGDDDETETDKAGIISTNAGADVHADVHANADASAGENESSSSLCLESKLCSNVCNICLDMFKVGDVVAHSSHSACTHVFHENCILSWLVTKQNPLCPCCRQQFVVHTTTGTPTRTPQTSIASQEPFSSAFFGEQQEEEESSTTQQGGGGNNALSSSAAGGDIEEGMTTTTTVISEDPERARRESSIVDGEEMEKVESGSEDPKASSIRIESSSSTDQEDEADKVDAAQVEDSRASSRQQDAIDQDKSETDHTSKS